MANHVSIFDKFWQPCRSEDATGYGQGTAPNVGAQFSASSEVGAANIQPIQPGEINLFDMWRAQQLQHTKGYGTSSQGTSNVGRSFQHYESDSQSIFPLQENTNWQPVSRDGMVPTAFPSHPVSSIQTPNSVNHVSIFDKFWQPQEFQSTMGYGRGMAPNVGAKFQALSGVDQPNSQLIIPDQEKPNWQPFARDVIAPTASFPSYPVSSIQDPNSVNHVSIYDKFWQPQQLQHAIGHGTGIAPDFRARFPTLSKVLDEPKSHSLLPGQALGLCRSNFNTPNAAVNGASPSSLISHIQAPKASLTGKKRSVEIGEPSSRKKGRGEFGITIRQPASPLPDLADSTARTDQIEDLATQYSLYDPKYDRISWLD